MICSWAKTVSCFHHRILPWQQGGWDTCLIAYNTNTRNYFGDLTVAYQILFWWPNGIALELSKERWPHLNLQQSSTSFYRYQHATSSWNYHPVIMFIKPNTCSGPPMPKHLTTGFLSQLNYLIYLHFPKSLLSPTLWSFALLLPLNFTISPIIS